MKSMFRTLNLKRILVVACLSLMTVFAASLASAANPTPGWVLRPVIVCGDFLAPGGFMVYKCVQRGWELVPRP